MTTELKEKVHSLLGVRCTFPESALFEVGQDFTARCMLENFQGKKPPAYKDTVEDIIIRRKNLTTASYEGNGIAKLKVKRTRCLCSCVITP